MSARTAGLRAAADEASTGNSADCLMLPLQSSAEPARSVSSVADVGSAFKPPLPAEEMAVEGIGDIGETLMTLASCMEQQLLETQTTKEQVLAQEHSLAKSILQVRFAIKKTRSIQRVIDQLSRAKTRYAEQNQAERAVDAPQCSQENDLFEGELWGESSDQETESVVAKDDRLCSSRSSADTQRDCAACRGDLLVDEEQVIMDCCRAVLHSQCLRKIKAYRNCANKCPKCMASLVL